MKKMVSIASTAIIAFSANAALAQSNRTVSTTNVPAASQGASMSGPYVTAGTILRSAINPVASYVERRMPDGSRMLVRQATGIITNATPYYDPRTIETSAAPSATTPTTRAPR